MTDGARGVQLHAQLHPLNDVTYFGTRAYESCVNVLVLSRPETGKAYFMVERAYLRRVLLPPRDMR